MLQPLAFDVATFNVPQGVTAYIRENVARRLPELLPAICSHDGTGVIAGSGPSLHKTWEGIKEDKAKGRPVMAVKGAHDFLVEKGIEPDLFISIDPRDRRNNVQRETQDTIYLLASRCAPQLFEHLKDRHTVIWHAGSGTEEMQCLGDLGVKYTIGGTSTSGMRAVNVFYHLGFRSVKMYGMDSCLADDGMTKRVDGSLTGQTIDVWVGHTGKKFTANIAMAEQAKAFQLIWAMMPDMKVEIVGDGLLKAILDERQRRGYWT